MRQLIIITFLTFIGFEVFSQNVGININSPQVPLHVYKPGAYEVARFQANNSDNSYLTIWNNTSLAKGFYGLYQNPNDIHMGTLVSNPNGRLLFSTESNNVQMAILPDGKIGIGVMNPAARLQIGGKLVLADDIFLPTDGAIRFTGSDFEGYDNGAWISFTQSVAKSFIQDNDLDTKIQVEENSDDDNIRFDLGGTEAYRMYRTNNGRTLFHISDAKYNTVMGYNAGTNMSSWSNTIYGHEAAESMTSASNSMAIGYQALNSVQHQNRNHAVGYQSLLNTTSADNTAFGYQSGLNNTTGTNNLFLGGSAGVGNIDGVSNTIVGVLSGLDNVSGDNNVFVGNYAGESITNSRNTIVGTFAGRYATGSGNVFLGFNAGLNESGNNKLYITNQNDATPLVYGDFATNLFRINGTLNVNNAYSLPTNDGSVNQVLGTNGSGNLSWVNLPNNTTEWSTNSNGIHYNLGNVGIGDSSPDVALDVNGAIVVGNDASTDINGMIKYDGDLKGYVAGEWKSLTQAGSGGGGQWDTNADGIYRNQLSVGIGTTPNPESALSIINAGPASQFASRAGIEVLSVSDQYTGSNVGVDVKVVGDNYYAASCYGLRTRAEMPIASSAKYYGLYADVSDAINTSYGLRTLVDGDNHYAIYGENLNEEGYAGYFLGRSRFTKEMGIGFSPSSENILTVQAYDQPGGIHMENIYSGSGTKYGMQVYTSPEGNGTKHGVFANTIAGGNFPAYGIYGKADAFGSYQEVYGVYGVATGNSTSNTYGVYAKNTGSNNTAWALYSEGRNYFSDVVSIGENTDLPNGYKLVVDGKIISEEVLVQDSGNWPDYVFEEDYELRSIQDVASYIDLNGHLPDVPSAEEVKKDGISVAEMHKIQMQKIEELTLYIIELKKEIELLKNK